MCILGELYGIVFIMKSMERVLHNGIQLDTVMKIVNAILELRIGVTNQIV